MTQPELRLGRAYDNDIVLDDPHVAPNHLRVWLDEKETWLAEDLGSVNGAFDDRGGRFVRTELSLGRSVTIGLTSLRIRSASDHVAPERALGAISWSWTLLTGLATAVVGLQIFLTWLRQTTETRLADFVGPGLGICVAVLAWALVWTLLARIFSGHARFRRNLLIALSGVLAFFVLQQLTEYGAFAFFRRELVSYRYVAVWILAALISYLHARLIDFSHRKRNLAIIASLAVLAIGAQTLTNAKSQAAIDRPPYVRSVKPPLFRLAGAETQQDFFAAAGRLKDPLDKARSDDSVENPGEDDDDD